MKTTYLIPIIGALLSFSVPYSALAYFQPASIFLSVLVLAGALSICVWLFRELIDLDNKYKHRA